MGESRGGLYAQVDRAFARVVCSFDGGTASGCVGLPTEIVGHPLPLYRHRHGVFSSSSLALLLLARFFSCAPPLFLVSLLPYYVVHISAVTWCARIIIQREVLCVWSQSGDAAMAEIASSVLLWNAISVDQLSGGSEGACLLPPAEDDLCVVL
jgi:hypothetical protein